MKAGKREVAITHKDKILFPKDNITKEDVVLYYQRVAKFMLPLIEGRPISMHRFPRGIDHEGFFQKQPPKNLPSWIRTKKVKRKEKEPLPMILCEEKATLLWLANQNCITPHIWLSKMDKPDLPDRMIFDLDPPTAKQFPIAVEGALYLRKIIETYAKLEAFVMTTGSKGLHVVVPIQRKHSFDHVRSMAHEMAKRLAFEHPEKFTLEIRKNKRKRRVYIDTLRNGFAQTTVAPYAIRAIHGAPIATPLFWEELKDKNLRPNSYTLRNISSRLKKNPWAGIEKRAGAIPD